MSNEEINPKNLSCHYGLVPIILRLLKEKIQDAHADAVLSDGIPEGSIHAGPNSKSVQVDDAE